MAKLSKRTKMILIIALVLTVVAASAAGLWYWNKQKKDAAAEAKKKADEKASIEAETIIEENLQPGTQSKMMDPTRDEVRTGPKEIPIKEPIAVKPKSVFDSLVDAAIPKTEVVKERTGVIEDSRIK